MTEKFELNIDGVRLEGTYYYQGAQKGSKYMVFQIEEYSDSFSSVCDLLENKTESIKVTFRPSEDEPLIEIGEAVDTWRQEGYFVKVLVKQWY